MRVIAGVAGALTLLLGTLVTAGAALAGAVGIGLVAIVMRSRRRRLTRLTAWLSAVAAAVLYTAVGAALLFQRLPDDVMAQARAAADSASAAQVAPAWIERMAPGTTERIRTPTAMDDMISRVSGFYGALIGVAIVASIFGSIAWGGVMLLALAFTGRWLQSPVAVPAAPHSI